MQYLVSMKIIKIKFEKNLRNRIHKNRKITIRGRGEGKVKENILDIYIKLFVSISSFNPLGDKVFNLKIRKASFLQSKANFSLSVLSEMYSIVMTSRHLMSMLWCDKKCQGRLCLPHPPLMNLLCSPTRLRNVCMVQPTYIRLPGH